MQQRARSSFIALAITGLLASCGGGGSGSQTSPEASAFTFRSAAQGFWSGRTETNGWADFIILEDGTTWGVFADAVAITGGAHGASWIESGRFTSEITEFRFQEGEAAQVLYSGAATPLSSIDAQGPGGRRLMLEYDPGYDSSPSLQALAGRYALDESTVLAINSDGAFNWIASASCVLTGEARPRASGRNVFDLALTYVGDQCPHVNGTRVNGVAYLDTRASPLRLVALALREDNAVGFISRASKFVDPDPPPQSAPAPVASPPTAPAADPVPPPAPVPQPPSAPLRISAGHYPPPGTCRIWVIGTPPGRQSPPGDCSTLEPQVTPGTVLIRG